jgi:hypothetical protein
MDTFDFSFSRIAPCRRSGEELGSSGMWVHVLWSDVCRIHTRGSATNSAVHIFMTFWRDKCLADRKGSAGCTLYVEGEVILFRYVMVV